MELFLHQSFGVLQCGRNHKQPSAPVQLTLLMITTGRVLTIYTVHPGCDDDDGPTSTIQVPWYNCTWILRITIFVLLLLQYYLRYLLPGNTVVPRWPRSFRSILRRTVTLLLKAYRGSLWQKFIFHANELTFNLTWRRHYCRFFSSDLVPKSWKASL